MEPTTSESSEPPVIYPNLKKFNKANPVPVVAPEGKFSLVRLRLCTQLRILCLSSCLF